MNGGAAEDIQRTARFCSFGVLIYGLLIWVYALICLAGWFEYGVPVTDYSV